MRTIKGELPDCIVDPPEIDDDEDMCDDCGELVEDCECDDDDEDSEDDE